MLSHATNIHERIIYSAVQTPLPYLGSHIYSTLFYLAPTMRGSCKETWRSCNYYVRTNEGLYILDPRLTPTINTTQLSNNTHVSYYNYTTHTITL